MSIFEQVISALCFSVAGYVIGHWKSRESRWIIKRLRSDVEHAHELLEWRDGEIQSLHLDCDELRAQLETRN